MRNHIHQNTRPRVPDCGPEPPARAQRNAPAGLLAALLAAVPGLLTATGATAVGETTRVSVNSKGIGGNDGSFYPSLSGDGRFVAFFSVANNLAAGDRNHQGDIFLHDRQTHNTTRVSVDSQGELLQGYANFPTLSANGQTVVFQFQGQILDPVHDVSPDIVVHDRQTRQSTRISQTADIKPWFAEYSALLDAPTISAGGRFVAFAVRNARLVPEANSGYGIYLHDRYTKRNTLVSVNSAGVPAGQWADRFEKPSISGDGQVIAFQSTAATLVPGDIDGGTDVFVHDRHTHQTTRVSVDSKGQHANDQSGGASISADGRFVAFTSSASNLVPGDTNGTGDVFVHDRVTHQTTRVSVDSTGEQGNGRSYLEYFNPSSAISADGRFIAFNSEASNLVPGDTNGRVDAFVHDRMTHQTTRVSVDTQGNQALGWVSPPNISADGRVVAFYSDASNLADGDHNDTALNRTDIFVRDRLLDRSATADIGITQTADPTPFVPLSPLTYTLTAVNHGPDAATEVTVNDSPALLSGTVLSVTPSQGSCSRRAPFVCYLGTLAPGASSTITVSLQPRWRGTVSLWNTAHVNAAPVDGNVANNQSTLRTDVAP